MLSSCYLTVSSTRLLPINNHGFVCRVSDVPACILYHAIDDSNQKSCRTITEHFIEHVLSVSAQPAAEVGAGSGIGDPRWGKYIPGGETLGAAHVRGYPGTVHHLQQPVRPPRSAAQRQRAVAAPCPSLPCHMPVALRPSFLVASCALSLSQAKSEPMG